MSKVVDLEDIEDSKVFDKAVSMLGSNVARDYLKMAEAVLKDELATAEVKIAETNKRYKTAEEYVKANDVKKTFNGALKDRLKEVNATTGIAALLLAGVNTEDAEETKEYKKARRVIGKKQMPNFMSKTKEQFQELIVANEVHKATLIRERDSNSQYCSAVSIKKELDSAIREDSKNPKAIVALCTLILGRKK